MKLRPLGAALALILGCRGGAPPSDAAPPAPAASASAPGTHEPSNDRPPATPGEVRWSRRIVTEHEGRVTAIAFGPHGEARVAGIFSGKMDLGGGKTIDDTSEAERHDGFVAVLKDDGSLDAPVRLQGKRDQTVYAMKIDGRGNTVVAGSYFGSVAVDGAEVLKDAPALNDHGFVLELDPAGKPVFSYALPSLVTSWVSAVAVDPSNAVWIAGTIEDLYVERLDERGTSTFRWSQKGSGSGAVDVAVDAKGNAIVVGFYRYSLSLGSRPVFALSRDQGFVVKLDRDGNLLWSLQLGPGAYAEHVAVDALSSVWVTGSISAPISWGGARLDPRDGHGVLFAIDADGKPRFAKQYTPWAYAARTALHVTAQPKFRQWFVGLWENGTLLALDPAGNPLLASTFEGSYDVGGQHLTTKLPRDVAFFKLDKADGRLLYARSVAGEGQLAHAVAVDGEGRGFIGGAHVDKPHGWILSAEP